MNPFAKSALLAGVLALSASAAPKPNLQSNLDRPLRYQPEGGDFVIRNGDRDRRNGDLRAGNLPISQFFQLRPEFSKDNSFDLRADATFTLRSKAGTIIGTTPAGAKIALAASAKWASPKDLFASTGKAASLPAAFAAAERFRISLADSLGIVTPDPFVNAAAQALGVAADPVWDEKQGI